MPLSSLSSVTGRSLGARLPYLLAVALVLSLDRATKIAILRSFGPGEGDTVVAGFFELVRVHNTGAAFGVLSGGSSTIKLVLLSGFAIAASLAVVIYSVRSPATERLLQTGLALILAGALGNLYDRVSYGYVIDFLYFHVGEYYWPAFNLADASISLGVAGLAAVVIQDEIRARS